MAQIPKDHVREAFVAAAADAFAELGFAATSMAAVAERAGSSVGNLYKYFGSKQELFEAAVPAELVQELLRRTRARIRALGTHHDVAELPPDAPYHALAGDLLDYCLEHRAAVVVMLARAEGTPFASFAPAFVEKLVRWALDYARDAYPEFEPTPELRFVLRQVYTSYVQAMAEALRQLPNEARARAVIALLTAHHQAGLKRLFETQGAPDADPRRAAEPSVTPQPARTGAGDAPAPEPNPSLAPAAAGKSHRAGRARRRR